MMMSLSALRVSRGFPRFMQRSTMSSLALDDEVIPTRHSRHLPPATCLDPVQLVELSQQVLGTSPGSLFSYHPSHDDDAWEVETVDINVQKVEFLLRGHAAKVPDSLWNRVFRESVEADDESKQHIEIMEALISRIGQEGELYTKLRNEMKLRSVELVSGPDDTPDHDNSSVASPGVTIAMMDALLDSMAVTPGSCTPTKLHSLLYSAVERHNQDGGFETNTNVHTVPTVVTFNATLRALTTMPVTDDKTRDEILQIGLGLYDGMRYHVDRNSATYTYLLQLINKCLPPSKTRGNIMHGMWAQAVQEQVVDANIIEALKEGHSESGEKFVSWVQEHLGGKVEDLPNRHWRYAKLKRYNRDEDIY